MSTKQPSWITQDEEELVLLLEEYLSALDAPESQRLEARRILERCNAEITQHRSFALLSLPLIQKLRSSEVISNYAKQQRLSQLLYEALRRQHPDTEGDHRPWDVERFRAALDIQPRWELLYLITHKLRNPPTNRYFREFYHQTWTSLWQNNKRFAQRHAHFPRETELVAFLSAFSPSLAFPDSAQHLSEIAEAFVPQTGPSVMPDRVNLFGCVVRALLLLPDPQAKQTLHALFNRLHDPERKTTPGFGWYREKMQELYVVKMPLQDIGHLLVHLRILNPKRTGSENGRSWRDIGRWNRLLHHVAQRLQHESASRELRDQITRTLQTTVDALRDDIRWYLDNHPSVREPILCFLKRLARLGVFLDDFAVDIDPEYTSLEVADFQFRSAYGREIPEDRLKQLIQHDDASVRNGSLYALAKQTHPATRNLFLQQLLVPPSYPKLAVLTQRLWSGLVTATLHPTTPDNTAWMREEQTEDAMYAALLHLTSRYRHSQAPRSLSPEILFKRMNERSWQTFRALIETRDQPTAQANEAWLTAFQDDLDTARWATWLLWPLAHQMGQPRKIGPQREQTIASAMLESLMHPAVPQEEHATKTSWLLDLEDPLLFDTLRLQATPSALHALPKHSKRRILHLLHRIDPQRLQHLQQELESSLFS
ncbi:MAG: hypothetical protein H6727_11820 [Myxococcales bacterium]|nr:hypothetical protein [Myxococcales bacterium]